MTGLFWARSIANKRDKMEKTENKEIEILVNKTFGGFGLSAMAEVWLLQRGYTAKQVRDMSSGDCPRDLPDLVEAFKRYGNGSFSSIEVQTLAEGTPYYIENYDGAETVVTKCNMAVAGAGIDDKGFVPPNGKNEAIDLSVLSRKVLDEMSGDLRIEWLRNMRPLLHSKLQCIYEHSKFDERKNPLMRSGMKGWAIETKEGRAAFDQVIEEAMKGEYL